MTTRQLFDRSLSAKVVVAAVLFFSVGYTVGGAAHHLSETDPHLTLVISPNTFGTGGVEPEQGCSNPKTEQLVLLNAINHLK